jgi:hypothetical protein
MNSVTLNMSRIVKPKEAGVIFRALVEKLGRDDLNEILFNWNESELNEDMTAMKSYPFRRNAIAGMGPVTKHGKTEFVNWLLSDAPFDTKVYGEEILQDKGWTELINRARSHIAGVST